MASPIALRGDFDGPGLRRLAKQSKDAAQARRLLALAEIYDGGSRTDAASSCPSACETGLTGSDQRTLVLAAWQSGIRASSSLSDSGLRPSAASDHAGQP